MSLQEEAELEGACFCLLLVLTGVVGGTVLGGGRGERVGGCCYTAPGRCYTGPGPCEPVIPPRGEGEGGGSRGAVIPPPAPGTSGHCYSTPGCC